MIKTFRQYLHLALLYFIATHSAKAQCLPLFQGNLSRSETSDHHSLKSFRLQFENERSDIFFPYESEDEKSESLAVSSAVHKVETASKEGSGVTFDFGQRLKRSREERIISDVGIDQFSFEGQKSHSSLRLNVALQKNIESKRLVQVEIRRQMLYTHLIFPGAALEALSAWQLNVVDKKILSDFWRVGFSGKIWWLSDQNERQYYDININYGRVYPVWWWVGVGADYIRYHQNKSTYWTPWQAYSYGLRSELALPIHDKWSLVGGLNVHQVREENQRLGDGSFLSAGVTYGSRNEQLVKLSYESIVSQQGGGIWRMQSFVFDFNRSF